MTEDTAGPKRRDDDCDMVTSLQAGEMSNNEKCLLEAARKNQLDVIKQVLERRAGIVNCKNHLDRTALHMAASQGHVAAADLLIKGKANVDAPDKYGMTPMLWAAYFGHVEVVAFLAEKGANILRSNKQGLNLVHMAAEKNYIQLFELIVTKYKRMKLDEPDNNGLTPLLTAVQHNNLEILKMLIDKECNLLQEDKNNKTVLHVAARAGHTEMLEFLLTQSQLTDKIDAKDSENKNALHYTCEVGHTEAALLLLNHGSDPNLETDRSVTPVMIAAQSEHEEIVRVLVDNGCDINAQSTQGNSALHLAAIGNLASMCQTLIELGAEIDAVNNRLQTPLHACVEQNKPDSAEILLLAGATLSLIDKTGKTPLLLASRGSYISLVDMIIKADRLREKKRALNGHHGASDQYETASTINDSSELPEDYASNTFNVQLEEKKAQSIIASSDGAVNVAGEGEEMTFRLKEFNQIYAEEFKLFLWRLAFKHLRAAEWQRLGQHWNFKREHLLAIEHQDAGEVSYKQHGFRLLCIWFHGVDEHETPVRELYEALVDIGRRELADRIRRELDSGFTRASSKRRCCVT